MSKRLLTPTSQTSTTINSENCESETPFNYDSDADEQGNLKGLVVDDIEENELNNKCESVETSSDDNEDIDINEKMQDLDLNKSLKLTNKPFAEALTDLMIFLNQKTEIKRDNITFNPKLNEPFIFQKFINGQLDTNNNEYLRVQRVQGSYFYVKIGDYLEFTILLNDVINNPNIRGKINYEAFKYNFFETYPDIVPLLFDIDYHYNNKYEGKRLYDEIIDIIINGIKKIVNDHYELEEKLKLYVMTKNQITFDNEKNDYKDGFHIFVDIPIKLSDYMSIHDELVELLKENEILNNWFKKYQIKTELNDFIDTHLKDKPFMMLGCTKYLAVNNYKPSPVYDLDLNKCEDDNIKEFKKFSVIKTSVNKFFLAGRRKALKLIKIFKYIPKVMKTTNKQPNKKQKLDNNEGVDVDLNTPTEADYFIINLDYTIDEIEFLTTLIKPETIGTGKYNNWLALVFAIWSYTETYNDEETKGRLKLIIHNLMRRGAGYKYNDTERLINDYNSDKGRFRLGTLIDFAKKDNPEAYEKFKQERENKKQEQLKEQLKEQLQDYRADTKIIKEEPYNIAFTKENFSNKIMSDLFLYNNVIEAIKYFYKYHIYDGTNIYRLQFTIENKSEIVDFSNEIKKQSYKEDMNNIKELDKDEIELINNTTEYGMQFIKDVIMTKKEKTPKGTIFKKSIKLYDALSKTLQFNISIKSDDLFKDTLLYGINYYNQYDIIIKRIQYFNTSKIAKYFYFDDILASKLNINSDDELIKPFIDFIDNVICTIKKPDTEKDEDYFNLIEQKKYYVYNYLKTIFNRKKNNTCLLLVAKKAGTGKTTFSKLINNVISNNLGSALPGADFFNDSYNGSDMDDKLFISLEEVEIGDTAQQRVNISNKIKNLITNDKIRIRKMRKDPKNKENTTSYCITSNAYSPVIMDNQAMNRRFAIFDINNKQSDKFYTDLNNQLENKEALKHFYNFIKNNEFHCHCKSPNCPECSDKPFEQQDAIMTPEKKNLIYNCAISDEKFLVDFYYLWKFAIAKKLDFQHLDEGDKTKINITFSQFYIEYKNYCKYFEIKPHTKDFFYRYCDEDLLIRFRTSYRTERIYKTIEEYREWLCNQNYIGQYDSYNFDDKDEVFEFGNYYFGLSDDDVVINIK